MGKVLMIFGVIFFAYQYVEAENCQEGGTECSTGTCLYVYDGAELKNSGCMSKLPCLNEPCKRKNQDCLLSLPPEVDTTTGKTTTGKTTTGKTTTRKKIRSTPENASSSSKKSGSSSSSPSTTAGPNNNRLEKRDTKCTKCWVNASARTNNIKTDKIPEVCESVTTTTNPTTKGKASMIMQSLTLATFIFYALF